MGSKAISLVGDLYLAPLASAGAPVTHILDALNAIEMVYKVGTIETKTRKGKGRDNFGTVLNTKTSVSEAATLEITNDEFYAQMLAIQTRGVASTLAGAGGAVADQDVTVKLDHWVRLTTNEPLTSATVTSTGLTEGTHFDINRRMGWVKFHSGVSGAPADDATVQMSFTKAVFSRSLVAMGTQLPGRYALFYDAINQGSGKNAILYAPQGLIVPSDDFGMITEDFAASKFLVTPELVTGETSALYYDEDE